MTKLNVHIRRPTSSLPPSEKPIAKKSSGCRLSIANILLVFLGCWFVAFGTAQTAEAPTRDQYRLPGLVKPVSYDLRLKPDFYGTNASAYQFKGSVSIEIYCKIPTTKITLQMKDLAISDHDISVRKVNSQNELFKISTYEASLDFLTLHLSKSLQTGEKYLIFFHHFSGSLTKGLFGLRLYDYYDGQERVYMVASVLAVATARKAFPCFDEPAMKAVFRITLLRRTDVPRTYTSISNNKLWNTSYITDPDGSQWAVDNFKPTPPMSTYLLALIVTDFKYLEQKTNNKSPIDVRVYARPNAIQYAQKFLKTYVQYFESLDRTFYPAYGDGLDKLDSVLLPGFGAEGFEAWGSIYFSEETQLRPDLTTVTTSNYNYLLVAHELAHMWFGNYVAISWWDHTWLYQGFAEWAAVYTAEKVHPTWKPWDGWKCNWMVTSAFSNDAKATSHPLVANVRTPSEILSALSRISYEKGAYFLDMLCFVMGEDNFITAVNDYLKRYKLSSADSADFMNELDKVMSRKNKAQGFVSSKMNPWLYQMGFPLVMVNKTSTGFLLSQKRFLVGSADATNDLYKNNPYGYQWNIPLLSATKETSIKDLTSKDIMWLDINKTVNIKDNGVSDWILVNVNRRGFYRVSYDDATWAALIAQLNKDPLTFPAIDRGFIIADAFTLHSVGMLELSEALKTLDYLKSETELPGWSAFKNSMKEKLLLLLDTKYAPYVKAYIENLVRQPVKDLPFDSNVGMAPKDRPVRVLLQWFSCMVNTTECYTESNAYIRKWRASSIEQINPDKRYDIGCNGIANGDSSDWQFMYQQLKIAPKVAEDDVLHVLACTMDPVNIERFINMTMDPTKIATYWLSHLALSVEGRTGTLKFIEERFDHMIDEFGADEMNGILGDVVKYTSGNQANIAKLKSFLGNQKMKSIHPGIRKAIATVEANQAWVSQNSQALDAWLKVRQT